MQRKYTEAGYSNQATAGGLKILHAGRSTPERAASAMLFIASALKASAFKSISSSGMLQGAWREEEN